MHRAQDLLLKKQDCHIAALCPETYPDHQDPEKQLLC